MDMTMHDVGVRPAEFSVEFKGSPEIEGLIGAIKAQFPNDELSQELATMQSFMQVQTQKISTLALARGIPAADSIIKSLGHTLAAVYTMLDFPNDEMAQTMSVAVMADSLRTYLAMSRIKKAQSESKEKH